jgi:hypothetical protein
MFDPLTFTGFHTWLSLVALVTGVPLIAALLAGRNGPPWSAVFLVTAIGTSATGFGFASTAVMPSHIIGAISLVVLTLALVARVSFRLRGRWHGAYALSIVVAVYFLGFVAIVQAFQKVPALHDAAPTLSEAPFAVTQGVLLLIFVVLAVAVLRARRPTIPMAPAV